MNRDGGVSNSLRLACAGAVATLVACATTHVPISGQPAKLANRDLCRAWAEKPVTQARITYQAAVWNEIVARNMFTAAQLSQIRAGVLEVGMPDAALLCVWGKPRRLLTVQKRPVHVEEWKFRVLSLEAGGAVSYFAYTCDGIIASIQNQSNELPIRMQQYAGVTHKQSC
jgi:hypothetical protein